MRNRLYIAVALFNVTLASKLIIDLNLYFSGEANNHLIGPIIVLVSLGVCTWLAKWPSIFMWLFMYWALFDSLFGLCIHQGMFYVGTTAKLDILQRDYPAVLWMKYFGAIVSTVYYTIWARKVI